MNLQKGLFDFIQTTRSDLSRFSFLDSRTLGQNVKIETIPAPQVIQALQKIDFRNNINQANYLFHTSFCCSTMLARCLDHPGKNLSLKEPFALLRLAAYKRFSAFFDPAGPNWNNLRDITLYLLARPFHSGEKILMKPSNGANNILPEILACRQTDKILLLYGDLEGFLISVLRGGQVRISSVAPILEGLMQEFLDTLPLSVEQIRSLNDLQRMSLVWGLQMQFLKQTMAQDNNQRAKSLNCKIFLQEPAETLKKLVDFYGLEFSDRDQVEILRGPAFNAHSKTTSKKFSKHLRTQEEENILNIFGKDIRETITWINSLGFSFEEGLENQL